MESKKSKAIESGEKFADAILRASDKVAKKAKTAMSA
jgi:hypothetical protein